jgi:hypothetical protein
MVAPMNDVAQTAVIQEHCKESWLLLLFIHFVSVLRNLTREIARYRTTSIPTKQGFSCAINGNN